MTVKKSTTKESMFLIGEHFYVLEELILEQEGEITEEIDRWLDEYQAKEQEKIDAYCYLIQKFEEISAEAKRLSERSSSYSRKARDLKSRLKYYLERGGKQKLDTPRFTVSICKNGGHLPVKLHEDVTPERMPDQFIRTFVEPDMQSLRQAITDGDEEAMRYAQLLPRGTHLRIK